MPRYIDADELVDEIEEEIEAGNEKIYEEDKLINKGLKIALKDIKKQPTVDAEPVKHGYWIDKGVLEDYPKPGINVYHLLWCSECGAFHRVSPWKCGGWINANYCPNCGAVMDGGKDNDNT